MKIKNKMILILFIFIFVSGCTNTDSVTFKEEKELLTNEILELKRLNSEKDEEIKLLKESNLSETTKLSEQKTSLEMIRWSSIARLNDYNNTFDNLTNIYKLHSDHIIKDDWYVINDDYFQFELLKYENATKVDFYTFRLESDQSPNLVFTDTDYTDGWKYTNETIGNIINKQKGSDSQGISYEPFFLIYTEVTLKDGSVIKTPNLPIYNK
ncbi:hypothetical protein ACFSFW_10440 [Fredinandcohnia salidurans]|uniref:Lipoprotein n=1 Tax=Fredinandcohnia salidurans TaxID=2595041 RepID=A0ABW4MMI5_9BACI